MNERSTNELEKRYEISTKEAVKLLKDLGVAYGKVGKSYYFDGDEYNKKFKDYLNKSKLETEYKELEAYERYVKNDALGHIKNKIHSVDQSKMERLKELRKKLKK